MDEDLDHHWLKQGSTDSGDVAKSYDDWADTYDETLADWDYQAPAKAAELLRNTVQAEAPILDAGCGTGLAGMALRAAGFTGPIDGIDISQTSLDEAAKHGLYRTLNVANMQALPLDIADDSYDALICIGVLTYIPDSEGILREFARLVRRGGTILVTQRDDAFEERDFTAVIDGLVADGILSQSSISEPLPYLPGNPDFGGDIMVIYAEMIVA